ncbi:hypothetical protein QR680_015997 [Steinernema hermaphroditum]|uniref:Uncharacterized protein n=1 Tax=Steinernema hermaphroditum TaxID=289476 RepID=A0AA39HC84_9BILA|nr:hypothetical protein QR680_015997 [Steinernema hermaphroditum]
MGKRFDEKLELCKLIRSKRDVLFGRSIDGSSSKEAKEMTWKWIYNECAARGHSWTIGKDWCYLRRSKWPVIKCEALKRLSQDLKSGGAVKKTTKFDEFILEFVLMPEIGYSAGTVNLDGIKIECLDRLQQSEGLDESGDLSTPSPDSPLEINDDSPEMSRRHEEKMELVRLIAERKRELFGRSYDGCDRSRKEEAWRGVFDECSARGHSWTIGKDWIYLRKSKWPGIKSDALKRREDDPRKSESLKLKANMLDGFVRENILSADQNDPNSFSVNDESTTVTDSPPQKPEIVDGLAVQPLITDVTQAGIAVAWEHIVGRAAPINQAQGPPEIPSVSASTSSPPTPAACTPAPQPMSGVLTTTASLPSTRCNSEVRSKYLDNIQLAQLRKRHREMNGLDEVPAKINGITARPASPLNGSAFSPVSNSSATQAATSLPSSTGTTVDDLQKQALEAQIEKDRAVAKYYNLQYQIALAQALGTQTQDFSALLDLFKDQQAMQPIF